MRNSVIKLVSYMNYFTSIQLRLNNLRNTLSKAAQKFEDLEYLTGIADSVKLGSSAQLNTRDDTFLDKGSRNNLDQTDGSGLNTRRQRKSVSDLSQIGEDEFADPNSVLGEHSEFIQIQSGVALDPALVKLQNPNQTDSGFDSDTLGTSSKNGNTRKGLESAELPSDLSQAGKLSSAKALQSKSRQLASKGNLNPAEGAPQPEQAFFDWIKTESMSFKFLMTEEQDHFMMKVSDAEDKAIVYDKAL